MEDLDFQDHPYEDTGKAPSKGHTVEFSDFPPDATEEEEESQDVREEEKPSPSVFTLAYYQQFFDVDTSDVLARLMGSMLPNPRNNYLEHVIRPKPDLYGPFWVCATLTFSIAITGNVADFFHTSGHNFSWTYDYGLVSLAATVIFAYWLIIPLIIWGVLKWRGSLAGYTLTELICVYGYSLAIFVPCSVLWLLPYPIINYLLAALCSLLSGATIVITLYPAVKNDSKQVMAIFMVTIVALHALLATGFVMYFFRYTSEAADIRPTTQGQIKSSTHFASLQTTTHVHPKRDSPHHMLSVLHNTTITSSHSAPTTSTAPNLPPIRDTQHTGEVNLVGKTEPKPPRRRSKHNKSPDDG